MRGAVDFRFVEECDADALAVSVFDEFALFLKDMPPEKDCDRLKGIFARRGFSTGAEAHICGQ